VPRGQAGYPGAGEERPEFADIGRLARRLMLRAVAAARAEDASVQRLVGQHLGAGAAGLPVATRAWPSYDQVNVQAGVDAWLAEPGRTHELVGLTNFRHREFGLADLLQAQGHFGPGLGSAAMEALPAGPGGVTRPCVQCGIYLTSDASGPAAILVRGPDQHGPMEGASVQVASVAEGRAQQVMDEIRQLSIDRNVFRGHVIAFGDDVFGHRRGALLSFADRPRVERDQVVLPPEVLDGIERQVLGVARHASRLVASGQHLRRGVLLYGPPGTGKTHTVRYLMSRLPGVTVVVLSGGSLGMIAEACSVARALQPSVVVVEDVDLIAEERGPRMGQHPLLFQLLNEMDGLSQDIDVTFLLTTNRADLLEQALAARPGRVDHAAQLPVPDAEARRRLLALYQGRLELDLSDPETVISRTEGVTASFIKELLRRAALYAAEDEDGSGKDGGRAGKGRSGAGRGRGGGKDRGRGGEDGGAPLRVTDAHLGAALDQLLDTRSKLTLALLGGVEQQGEAAASGPARSRSVTRRRGSAGPS
jgi:ATPase family associated with various cellular activities (AAA)